MRDRRPPWRKFAECHTANEIPHRITLIRWRRVADELAKARGAAGACHLCKRPVQYLRATMTLTACQGWRQRPLRLRLCYSCEKHLRRWLELMQVTQFKEDEPIDERINGN